MKINNKKKKMILTVGIALTSLLVIGMVKKANYVNKEKNLQTITLSRKDINNSISTSGMVISDEKVNVYTNLSVPIKEINVSLGDQVKIGDVLAVLDTSALENELKQSKLTYKGSLESLNENHKDNNNNIVNAKTGLEASKIALSLQELHTKSAVDTLKGLEIKEDFDSKALDYTIDELKLLVSNKEVHLNKMSKDEEKLKDNLYKFDDSDFKKESLDKSISLTRKNVELRDLEQELEREKTKAITFDNYAYKNIIEDSNRDYGIKSNDLSRAQSIYDSLNLEYKNIISKADALEEEKNRALEKVRDQEQVVDRLRSELTDASLSGTRAKEGLERAENEFYRNSKDLRESNIRELEKNYQRVKYEIEDLEREYDELTQKLGLAKKNELQASLDKYENISLSINDQEYELVLARNNYEKALLDKERAIKDYIENNKKELTLAERNMLDSKKQLESSQNNLKNSRNALTQASDKNISTVTSDINKLGVERLESQIENGKVIATSNGVVTEIRAEVGAMTGDILFVIEDIENIHIKARIKEHNLGLIDLGQKINITTVATGEEGFDGTLSYISPRATSQSDSPSVEFEIFSKPSDINTKIKLGMNAFLNIIIESKKNVFVVPLNAVVKEGTASYIHTIEGEKIPVETGIATKTELEIKGNLLKEGIEIRTDVNDLYTGEINDERK